MAEKTYLKPSDFTMEERRLIDGIEGKRVVGKSMKTPFVKYGKEVFMDDDGLYIIGSKPISLFVWIAGGLAALGLGCYLYKKG